MTIQAYPSEIEQQMRNFYNSLSEKDRRRYAAIEVTKLGYGGTVYISDILQCDDKTITRGQRELNTELFSETKRIRQKGAGRKQVLATTKGLDDVFLDILKNKGGRRLVPLTPIYRDVAVKRSRIKISQFGSRPRLSSHLS